MARSHVSKAPPKPATRACPSCEQATWRFNGRAWYASDLATRRRHVCEADVVRPEPVAEVTGSNGRRVGHELPVRRGGMTVTAVVAAALAGIGGLYAARALRR